MSTWRSLQLKLAVGVLVVACAVAAVVWFKNTVLVIESSTGTPFGSSVRADDRIATLIQALEPYTPSLHRDPSKDRYRMGLHLVPVDGSAPGRLIPIVGDQPVASFRLAKILGSDGRTLWFDVNGIGGVDLRTYKRVTAADLRRANPSLAAHWWEDTRGMEVDGRLRLASRDRQEVLEVDPATLKAAPVATPQRSSRPPFAPTPAAYLGAGFFTAPTEWLGLHSPAEVERELKPNAWLRRVVRAQDARELRRFYRGVLDPDPGGARSRIVSMTPLGDDAYLNAAFLRMDEKSEPLRLSNPDGALIAYTSAPGLKGTLMVARVDTAGNVLWKTDTGIDRFKLSQILPGDPFMAFVGPRPAVPDKVPEPLLVILDNRTGKVAASTLWQ
jgi:hypothetical protein